MIVAITVKEIEDAIDASTDVNRILESCRIKDALKTWDVLMRASCKLPRSASSSRKVNGARILARRRGTRRRERAMSGKEDEKRSNMIREEKGVGGWRIHERLRQLLDGEPVLHHRPVTRVIVLSKPVLRGLFP